jgi:DNA-binding response OmpR family regulator
MSSKRILFVDDHEDTCEMVALLLGWEGYQVTTAFTAADGLSLARSQRFDLYIIDEWLPDGRGVELVSRVQSFEATTPILYYTADARASLREEALGAGAQAFIVKPSEPKNLIETIKRLLIEAEVSPHGLAALYSNNKRPPPCLEGWR